MKNTLSLLLIVFGLYGQTKTVQSIFDGINNSFKAATTDQLEQITATGLKNFEDYILKVKSLPDNDLGQWIVLYRGLEEHIYKSTNRSDTFIDKHLKLSTIHPSISGRMQIMIEEFRKREKIEREFEAQFEIGKTFPAFPAQTKDMNQKIVKLSDYDNKIVLLDFWATWCGPCLVELPNVIAAYKKYKNKGFEILGISLDNVDRETFTKFIKDKDMNWTHIYDGKGWQSKVSKSYGIDAIPATFILKNGKIVAKNLRGSQLDAFLSTQF